MSANAPNELGRPTRVQPPHHAPPVRARKLGRLRARSCVTSTVRPTFHEQDRTSPSRAQSLESTGYGACGDFVNLENLLTQSFGDLHRGRVACGDSSISRICRLSHLEVLIGVGLHVVTLSILRICRLSHSEILIGVGLHVCFHRSECVCMCVFIGASVCTCV